MKHSTSSALKALLICAFAFAALAATASSAGATIQLGAYTPNAPASASALAEYSAMVGRQPEIVMYYREFGEPLMYSNEAANLRATGQTPMVTWEPYDTSLSSIASGASDAYLVEQAQLAKQWGGPLMIRFAHEMNGNWYPWAASAVGTDNFVAAWRHVVDVFRAAGANNVKWVWSPNVQEGGKYQIAPDFPGDSYIDYVGLDGYNWGATSGNQWQSFESVFASSYALVTTLSSKPVMITEMSSSEVGGNKAAWIQSTFIQEIPTEFPRVTAVIWFNKSQEQDWRINSSSASLAAYRSVVKCSVYGGTEPCGTTTTESEPTPEPIKKPKPKKPAVHGIHVTAVVPSNVGGMVSYGLTEAAGVEVKVVPRGHKGTKAKLVRHVRRGRHRIPLKQVLRRHKLARGLYLVVIRAKAGDGRHSRTHRAHFRVV